MDYLLLAFYGCGLLAWLILGRRARPATWRIEPPGFRAEPRLGYRVVLWILLAGGLVLCVLNTVLDNNLNVAYFAWVFVALDLIRSPRGAVTVTPAGLGLGKRVYPWNDVHLAYLEGGTVELRVTPRWVTWFGDRRLLIRGRQFLVPAAEMHWLIQHYLLFPAQRERMDTLPTRAYELPR